MSYAKLDSRHFCLVAISVLTLFSWLGGSSSPRLSYHEALVAQGAREMLARNDWLVPTINGQPWVEKPPLAHWLTMLVSLPFDHVSEFTTRLPSAIAAFLLVLALVHFTNRHFGPSVGLLAGLVQLTTYWTVMRGRLADADLILACLVTCCLTVFDRLRDAARRPTESNPKAWTVLFFLLLGSTSLAKGVGFGAVLVVGIILSVVIWDRDWLLLKRLFSPLGWALVLLISLAWPLLLIRRYPEALQLWTLHVTDRLADRPAHFAGGPWWSYLVAVVSLALPWTPIALIGLPKSVGKAIHLPYSVDRFLLSWSLIPIALLSLATVKNAHYAIYAMPPWSIWAALGLVRLSERWQRRGWNMTRWKAGLVGVFFLMGITYSLVFGGMAWFFDERGREWQFYQQVSGYLPSGDKLALIHDDWDRLPYRTPFGPVPHDLAVRLFYLNRSDVGVRDFSTPNQWIENRSGFPSLWLIAREQDLDHLSKLGRVELVAQGPQGRWDRCFGLYRVEASDGKQVSNHIPGAIRR